MPRARPHRNSHWKLLNIKGTSKNTCCCNSSAGQLALEDQVNQAAMSSHGTVADTTDWQGFHRAALSRPARELLRRTLGFFEVESRPPGTAVDLGCGSGPDTAELLRRGWTVHAVDASVQGLQLLEQATPAEHRPRLRLHAQAFETFAFPAADLVWAGYSLPFCAPGDWAGLWRRAVEALRPGGRIAGDLFGPQHAFGAEGGVLLFPEAEARALMHGLQVEAFDVEDGHRPSGGRIARWHAFGFACRKA